MSSWADGLALVLFVACVAGVQMLVLFPTSFTLLGRRCSLHYAAVPPVAALLMLAAGCLSPSQFLAGKVLVGGALWFTARLPYACCPESLSIYLSPCLPQA